MFIIHGNGIQVFASDSILECFEYMKKAPELMPKSYKTLQLELPEWFNKPMLSPPVSLAPSFVPVGNGEIHIHIHIGDK